MTEPANRPWGETDPIFGQPTPEATTPPPPWATTPGTPPPMMVDPAIMGGIPYPPATKSNHAGAWIAGILVGLLVIVLVAIAASSGSKDTPYLPPPTDSVPSTDYHNVADLQASMTDTIDGKILQKGLSGAVTDVVCVPGASDNQFICNVQYTDNTSESVTVTVSPDGQTWVSQ